MALRERASHRGRGIPGSSLIAAWPLAVSVMGGWLRQQSRRPGPVGDAAGLAVVVVNRSARLLGEVSAEVVRATGRADEGTRGAAPKRRAQNRKAGSKSAASKREKSAG
ncbi:MAG: hypothetical protein WA809_08260 [Candidatus Dormiibacterota bacterium]